MSSCKKEETGDGIKPEIILLGLNPSNWGKDVPYVDPGAIAFDVTTAGDTVDITNSIFVKNTIDVSTIGKYEVVYNVRDASGLSADEKIRIVNVVDGK